MCLAQGHSILTMAQDWGGRNMIFLWTSCTKRIRNLTAGSDIDRAPRSEWPVSSFVDWEFVPWGTEFEYRFCRPYFLWFYSLHLLLLGSAVGRSLLFFLSEFMSYLGERGVLCVGKVEGGGPRVVVSTAAFHASSVPVLGGLKGQKMCESQFCGKPPWPRGSVLSLRPPGLEFWIMCLEDSVISIISPSSGGSPDPV